MIYCRVCNSKELIRKYKNSGYIFYECRSCGYGYIDSSKNDSNGYFTWGENIVLESLKRKKMYLNRIGYIKKYASGKELLDVGAGGGGFLYYAQKNGFNVSGVEPSSSAVTFINKKYGLNVCSCTIKDIRNKSFDVITYFHVLEHIDDITSDILQALARC